MRKLGYYKQININSTSKYIPKEYNTPKMIGEKWQIDVKFVPTQCLGKDVPSDKKYYQYTCIDEATRERFLFWYDEHTPSNTVDFVKDVLHILNINLSKYKLIMVPNLLGIKAK